MNGPLRVRGIEIPDDELSWRFSRAGGPGGQSVNTTDSKVELRFDVAGSRSLPEHLRERVLSRLDGRLVDGVLVVVASEYRSQHRNRQAARARLGEVLDDALRPPARQRRATAPTRGARERRLAGKRRRSEVKALRRRPVD